MTDLLNSSYCISGSSWMTEQEHIIFIRFGIHDKYGLYLNQFYVRTSLSWPLFLNVSVLTQPMVCLLCCSPVHIRREALITLLQSLRCSSISQKEEVGFTSFLCLGFKLPLEQKRVHTSLLWSGFFSDVLISFHCYTSSCCCVVDDHKNVNLRLQLYGYLLTWLCRN